MNKRYCNIKEVSSYTSLPVKTLYEWASLGRIPSIKIGRRVLFDLNDIDSLMQKMKREANLQQNIVNKIIEGIKSNDI